MPCEASLPRALHQSTDAKRILASRTVTLVPFGSLDPCTPAYPGTLAPFGPLRLSPLDSDTSSDPWPSLFCGPLSYCSSQNFLDPSHHVDPGAFRTIGPFHCGRLSDIRILVRLRTLGLLDHCVWLTLGTFGPLGLLYPSNPWTLRTIGWTLALGAEADRSEPALSN